MTPSNRARRKTLRAVLSALAGGGLTAATLGAPFVGAAVGDTSTSASEGATPATETTATTPEAEPGGTPTTTTTSVPTSTTETPTTSTAATPTTSTPTPTAPSSGAPGSGAPQAPRSVPPVQAPAVVLQRKQKASSSSQASTTQATSPQASSTPSKKKKKKTAKGPSGKSAEKATGPNGVDASPQSVAAEAGQLVALLASAEASDQALGFYRIPLFLLPIYKAAAVQYGVPWQILAAINEIETDYGSDLSVSTAGAVGWMQFMPSTWLQYGVDALNAGYADPYNPVDAIFAAARYLRAAGAATNLRAAILAYNHSEEYVESVLLRAKLISTYPNGVIATLTGLIDGRLPVTGKRVAWNAVPAASASASSATANAMALPGKTAGSSAIGTPGSTAPLSPSAAAAAATAGSSAKARPQQLIELLSSPNASVVAVQDGRIMRIGHSRKLGNYVVLRDVYGDVFTYAGLGSIAPTYVLAKSPGARVDSPVVDAASTRGPAPSQAASAGTQPPVTLHVKSPSRGAGAEAAGSVQNAEQAAVPAGMEKVRLFAHPGNVDARAAARASAARRARRSSAGKPMRLRAGSVVASGTVIGRVRVPPDARDGHLRFAIRPAGDAETIDPAPVLANWAQLQRTLHPRGAKATNALLGATASDVFLLSKVQLERAVLSDPGITLDACARREVAVGAVDKRVLAVLAFLSRSGLEPTVSALRCGESQLTGARTPVNGEEVDISAINDTKIAGHQGAETITDLTIRTLLSLPAEFVPRQIVSLMRFPNSPSTHASAAAWNHIHLEFGPARRVPALSAAATATTAHSARSGRTAPSPLVTTAALSAGQWNQLMARVAALPMPTIPTKPSSAAIPDPKSAG
ncbi:MAG: lytic murein transglycosylase [Solirubrobacteraceae bacterium]